MKQLYLTFLLLFILGSWCFAQHTYTITFNESGQITSELPTFITKDDKIQFVVVGTQSNYEKRIEDAYERYLTTITNLDKNTKQIYKDLDDIDLDNVNTHLLLWGVQRRMASMLLNWLTNDPSIRPILEKKRNVTEDIAKLKLYTDGITHPIDDGVANTFIVPDPATLSSISYVVEVNYNGAFPVSAIPCTKELKFTETKDCCHWIFTSETTDPFPTAIPFYRLNYKLRLRNNLLNVLTDQLKQFDALIVKVRKIDVAKQKIAIDGAIDGLKKNANPDEKLLYSWMDSKAKGQEDKTNYDHLKAIFDGKVAGGKVQQSINDAVTAADATQMLDPDVLRLMLDFSWITQGKNLTLNPLTNGIAKDPKGQINTKIKTLADSTTSLTALNSKIDLYSGMLKASSQICCQTNYATQLTAYNKMIDLQKTIIKAQAQLTADIQNLKDLQPKALKDQSDYKRELLSDSLFYAGFLDVNNIPENFNGLNYHFMRHHDELNDYRHMDIKLQKEINEKQFMDAIAENHDPNKHIVIKYTFTTITNDNDFFGAQMDAAGQAAAEPSLDAIYNTYNGISKLYLPYENGVINLPITPVIDKTPNYVSKTNSQPDPDKYPTLGAYVFQDSLSGKNLSSQSAQFNFRVNKLYRFRLTAGISYSTLTRASYTINAVTNTATVTHSLVGAAPAFGVQYFPFRPIDIQHDSTFKDSWPPFVYIGYMYNDAPINNFLIGAGTEILSGFAIAAGAHLGESQQLYTDEGNLQTRQRYKVGFFVTVTFGLEAFKAIFNTTKSLPNPGSK